jgi:hypothetical protein
MARAPGAGTPGASLVSDQREANSYGPHGRPLARSARRRAFAKLALDS